MPSTQDPTKAPTTQEIAAEKDTVAETIAYARRAYRGNQKDVKVEPENNGFVKKLLNNVSHALQSNRYGGAGGG
ncbi:uncharacterized protein EKO05_0007285 [Ascochyta rabiei]|uniref:Uncharacterized protein n=1 Tax=Didymella rabiei TaxID=5454 RepID=A0A163BVJ0_DIDRA|nr:uncharacterized protein EKO05_0007285 [Ascochyta rabiei]KZM22030.1 hypothetical protein ST47_g6836 [Ascochyta rabiei]UPX16904.1 hypothetical protein EKO05_0007285 [Ascochyta rabiei]